MAADGPLVVVAHPLWDRSHQTGILAAAMTEFGPSALLTDSFTLQRRPWEIVKISRPANKKRKKRRATTAPTTVQPQGLPPGGLSDHTPNGAPGPVLMAWPDLPNPVCILDATDSATEGWLIEHGWQIYDSTDVKLVHEAVEDQR